MYTNYKRHNSKLVSDGHDDWLFGEMCTEVYNLLWNATQKKGGTDGWKEWIVESICDKLNKYCRTPHVLVRGVHWKIQFLFVCNKMVKQKQRMYLLRWLRLCPRLGCQRQGSRSASIHIRLTKGGRKSSQYIKQGVGSIRAKARNTAHGSKAAAFSDLLKLLLLSS